MTLEQHIEELRAELGACFDAREAREIAAELNAAKAHCAALAAAEFPAHQLRA